MLYAVRKVLKIIETAIKDDLISPLSIVMCYAGKRVGVLDYFSYIKSKPKHHMRALFFITNFLANKRREIQTLHQLQH